MEKKFREKGRVRVTWEATAKVEDHDPVEVSVTDIGVAGASILAKARWQKNSSIALSIKPAARGTIDLTGTILWCKEDPASGEVRMGIVFDRLPSETIAHLAEAVASVPRVEEME